MVCLNARHPDVDVPKDHKNNPSLNLIFNFNFKKPIKITEEGLSATLAFQGKPHACVIPFEAVWAIFMPHSKEGQVWDESIPEEVNLNAQKGRDNSLKKPPSIKAMPGGVLPSSNPKEDCPKKDKSHLRVIK